MIPRPAFIVPELGWLTLPLRQGSDPVKRRYKPKLDPERDLAGATPETLALALLGKRPPLRPGPGGQAVVGDEPSVRERTPRKPDDDRPHLVKGIQVS